MQKNPPAFPRAKFLPDMRGVAPGEAFRQIWADRDEGAEGMSLRDYFAGLALQGILSGKVFTARRTVEQIALGLPAVVAPSELAEDAYGIADAMLAERQPKPPAKEQDDEAE